MVDPTDLMKAVPEDVVKEIYSDAVSDTLKEAGKIGVDVVKTLRLVLLPIQYTAMLQNRLARHLKRAIDRVPSDDRIAPVQSITLEIADRVRNQEDDSLVAEMYVSLLARAMDRKRVWEAHPAFVQLIGQLAPDEALLIEQLSRADPSLYIRVPDSNVAMTEAERSLAIAMSNMSLELKEKVARIAVAPEELGQQDLVYVYIEHLVSLGLVSYVNEPWSDEFKGAQLHECSFWFITLNGFGKLFHRACLSDRRNK
ncbi:hypothetical protein LMG28614_05678 [Paraburkholderia ultramafica]|uniref:DUF4393 domain-containing protein n=1 Tax=Paraburkholderia ultramafica TaxID=1544867 RepID=A0A6S7BKA1_9BURK|nr:Abi-alpha family protein [Paraburkholderia ultramafica]CAB3802708.1 hypothetical protein LMG28614_05678 [Paraburkholderia ultramafica]